MGVRNYVHIGTGNYHSTTARLYTDFGLFTTDEQIGADVTDMFNYLTGYGRPLHYRKVLIAPAQLRDGLLDEIERTIAAHSPEHPARIAMKMNALVDGRCIRALYAASQAGVRSTSTCAASAACDPASRASPRTSASSRSWGACSSTRASTAFERDGEHTVYIASADLMPRNLDHRVELAVPIETPELRAELLDTLERAFADNQTSWELEPDGVWRRRCTGTEREPAQPPARADRAARPPRRRGAPRRARQHRTAYRATAGSSSSACLRSSTDW